MTEEHNQLEAAPASNPEDRAAARARAIACGEEIAAVLKKHSCRIMPYIGEPEPVGRDGSKLIIQASYGIIPDVVED